MFFPQRRLKVFLDALNKVVPEVKVRLNPPAKHWRNYTWRILSTTMLPGNEKIWTYWKSSKGPQGCLRDWSTSPMRKAERAETDQSREEGAQG